MPFHHTRPHYPIREIFQILGVSPPTGYKLIGLGLLETYTVGNKRFGTADAVDKCVATMEQRKHVELPKKEREAS